MTTTETTETTTTTFDFQDGHGHVPAKRHTNPDGSLGGWVADTATVASTAHVGPNALVFGSARVSGSAAVYGNAEVYGSARVFGSAHVYGSARVYDSAQVSGSAMVDSDHALLTGRAGGYICTAYVDAKLGPFLQYGCESHPLTWWLKQDESLSVYHGEDRDHWKFVEATIQMVQTVFGGDQ